MESTEVKMKFPRIAGVKESAMSNRSARHVTGWLFALWLIVGCLRPAFSAEVNPYLDPPRISGKDNTVASGACRIAVVGTSFWRDWMPIVGKPGPDGGSPLHARVKLSLDNSAGDAGKLSFRVVIVDQNGQSYSSTFRVLPNFRVLPDEIFKACRNYDDEAKKAAIAKYNVLWDGGINPGEVREVELATAEGPYLPVGSSIHVRIEWTDQKGNTVVVRSPDEPIKRTD
jgi:hypothetical protein